MGFYNIVNAASLQAGQPEDVSQVLANFQAVAAVLNGSVDNSNIGATAAIARSKLDFGLGLVNADIAAAAGILGSKVQFSRGAAPPGGPADGDIWQCTVDATNGVYWLFRYNASSASGFKWEFIGGTPFLAEVVTKEQTASAAYVGLATAGPTLTTPRAGDYEVSHGALLYTNDGGAGAAFYVVGQAIKIAAAAAADGEAVFYTSSAGAGANPSASVARTMKRTLALGDVLTAQYKTNTGTMGAANRWVALLPIRVS